MTSAPQLSSEMTTLGTHPATLDRYMRPMRAAGLLRRSGHGGRSATAHMDHTEVAAVLLALTAPHPGGAVDAVTRLGSLERAHRPRGSGDLLNGLASTIRSRAIEIAYGVPVPAHENWELVLCLAPLSARMTWNDGDRKDGEHFHDPSTGDRPAVSHLGARREFVITWDVIEQAANVVLDGLRRTKTIPPIEPTPSTMPSSTTADMDETGAAAAPPANGPRDTPKQAAKKAPATVTTVQPILSFFSGQPGNDGDLSFPTLYGRTHPHAHVESC